MPSQLSCRVPICRIFTQTPPRSCLPPYACDALPRELPLVGDQICDPHHEGVRCAVCSKGAYRNLEEECVGCENLTVEAFAATFATSLCFIVVAVRAAYRYSRLPVTKRHAFEASAARVQRKARILIGFVQVLTQLPHAFPKLRFPLPFLQLLNWLPVFALDFFAVRHGGVGV